MAKTGVKCTAIVLAGGSGSRMGTKVAKQYIEIDGFPIIYYTLEAFENSMIDDIILVCRESDVSYCTEEIVKKYGFTKVSSVVVGGKERFDSVYEGLKAAKNCDYVFIHDGARPCITDEVIERCFENVVECRACVAAVPVKDTIKISDEAGFVAQTPTRSTLWQIQTPQVFEYSLVKSAFDKMYENNQTDGITDDAMVVERFGDCRVKLVMGSYSNIKVTTPEDLRMITLKNS